MGKVRNWNYGKSSDQGFVIIETGNPVLQSLSPPHPGSARMSGPAMINPVLGSGGLSMSKSDYPCPAVLTKEAPYSTLYSRYK